MENENWKEIPGYEGHYEVSDKGRVRSLDRTITQSNGVRRKYKGVELKCQADKNGYRQVLLHKNGRGKGLRVHRLMWQAFVGPIPEGMEMDHINNIPDDNRLENLQVLTPAENTARQKEFGTSVACRVKNGTHHHTAKTHCPRGHDYYPENLVRWKWREGTRFCLVCRRAQVHIRRHDMPEEWHWAVYDMALEKFLLEKEEA